MTKRRFFIIEFYAHGIFGLGAFIMHGEIRIVLACFVLQIELPWLNAAFHWCRRKLRRHNYKLAA